MVGLHCHGLLDFGDRQPRDAGKQLGEFAFMLRVEMLDQHEGHARILRQFLQEFRKRLVAARRSADADHRK